MKRILFALLFVCSTAQAIDGDNYIASTEGKITLFSLPGCGDMLYGIIQRSDGTGDLACWKYEQMVVHVYIGKRDLTFFPSDVRTEGASEDPSHSSPYQYMPLDRLAMSHLELK